MITGRPRKGRLHKSPQCPCCKRFLDAWNSCGAENPPEEGGYSVCCYCGSLLQFEARRRVFLFLNDRKFKKLDKEMRRKLCLAQAVVAEINKQTKGQ